MKTIARILCLSFFCSALAGWLAASVFREYADHLVPAVLFGASGGVVGAIAGAAYEIVRGRSTATTQ